MFSISNTSTTSLSLALSFVMILKDEDFILLSVLLKEALEDISCPYRVSVNEHVGNAQFLFSKDELAEGLREIFTAFQSLPMTPLLCSSEQRLWSL